MADQQYLFVNTRPVKDRLLVGALRAAYRDLLARDRHPVAALFIQVPGDEVDINVHPAKTEVRFRDPAAVRGLIVGGLRAALEEAGHRSSAREQFAAPAAWQVEPVGGDGVGLAPPPPSQGTVWDHRPAFSYAPSYAPLPQGRAVPASPIAPADVQYPLGVARGQVAATYIVAEAEDGLVIVDQHAAHERLVLERMRKANAGGAIPRQALLIAETVELDEVECDRLEGAAGELAELGLEIERFGPTTMLVRATPAALGQDRYSGLAGRPCRRIGRARDRAGAARRARPCRGDDRLPRVGTGRADPVGGGDECVAARDGGHPAFRPMQPWPSDVDQAGA